MKRLSRRSRRAAGFCLATLTVAVLTASANAQVTAAQQSAIRSNCRSDFMSKCSGVTPGGKDALMCLQKNVASLSPGCKTAVSATMPAPAEPKPAQAAPAPAPAAPAAAAAPAPAPAPAPAVASAPPPPPAAPTQAAKTVAPPPPAPKPQQATAPKTPAAPPKQAAVTPAPVTPPPAAAPMPSAQQMKAVVFTCKREFSRYCKDVVKGGAQQVACLHAHADKLSPDCMTSLADLGDAMPAPAVAPPPPVATPPKTPLVMTAVIGRSCLRDLIKHCRGTGIGEGQKLACLQAHADDLTILCKTAMKITTPLR